MDPEDLVERASSKEQFSGFDLSRGENCVVAQGKEGRMNRAVEKRQRVVTALSRQEPDRVPVGEFFWGAFVNRWREKYSLPKHADPYRYFDLDYVVISPNMDPHIKNFEVIERNKDYVVVRTGWECIVREKFGYPMPSYLDFSVKTRKDMEEFRFDDPYDCRRYHDKGDDMFNDLGDAFIQEKSSFISKVDSCRNAFCVFGSVCDPYETLWRIVGSTEALQKLALEPEAVKDFNARIAEFMIGIGRAQFEQAKGALSGIYIWGDVAYTNGMLFSPAIWEKLVYPHLETMCKEFHSLGMKIIYHSCGDTREIMDMLIDAGIDGYNPLEAKAGLDVVEMKRKYGNRLAWVGNIDLRVLTKGNREAIRKEVLSKLNAAKGGGYIFQSDHSIASDVPPENYRYALDLAKKFGEYPLSLGKFDRET